MIFLDSSFLINIIRNNDHALAILEVLQDSILVSSVINVYEIWLGFYKNKRIQSDPNYRKIIESRILTLFDGIQVLTLEERGAILSAKIGGSLITDGKDIGDKDTIICGIMKNFEIKYILTSNTSHFDRLENIIVIDENSSLETIINLFKTKF